MSICIFPGGSLSISKYLTENAKFVSTFPVLGFTLAFCNFGNWLLKFKYSVWLEFTVIVRFMISLSINLTDIMVLKLVVSDPMHILCSTTRDSIPPRSSVPNRFPPNSGVLYNVTWLLITKISAPSIDSKVGVMNLTFNANEFLMDNFEFSSIYDLSNTSNSGSTAVIFEYFIIFMLVLQSLILIFLITLPEDTPRIPIMQFWISILTNSGELLFKCIP